MSSSRTMMKPVQLLQFSLNCSRDVSSSLFGRGAVQPFHWIRSGREMMPERTDLGGSRMAARGTWKGLELAVLPLSDVAGRRRSTEFRTYPPNEDCTKVFVRIILFLLAPTAKGRGKQYRTESPIRSSHPACMHACIRRARGGFRSSVSRSSGEEYDLNSSGRRLNSPASRRRTAHVVRSRSVGGIQLTKGEMDMAWEPFVAGPYKMGDIFLRFRETLSIVVVVLQQLPLHFFSFSEAKVAAKAWCSCPLTPSRE
ncbi:hypothetical protein GW17_00028813 [Ensete ventricosum]|nr:hypothetical protein GW17_00028813 [Ensete ventricosum]